MEEVRKVDQLSTDKIEKESCSGHIPDKPTTQVVHGEIQYAKNGDASGEWVHSDICPPDCNSRAFGHIYKDGTSYRKYLHGCLDEWLDESGGTGGFYIKNEKFCIL